MAKTTTKKTTTKKATTRTAAPRSATFSAGKPISTQSGGRPVAAQSGVLQPRQPTEEKVTNAILMLAADDEGISFVVNGSSREFYVPLDDPNYAAMTSLLMSVQATGGHVAVKYTEPGVAIIGNRRRATALAKGVNAVISGSTF